MDYESDNYRQIPKSKVIDVPDTPAFGKWKNLFSPKAVSHPAKMNQNLLRYLLKRYTAPGEVVLDPMSGTGATGVQAALLGRHGVCVEYEKWMVDMARETVDRVGKHSQLTPKGTMTMIHGDARELSRVVRAASVDAAVFSPPHSESVGTRAGGKMRWTPEYQERGANEHVTYSDDPDNIGNKPHGDIDAIVTSPPYAGSQFETKDKPPEFWEEMARRRKRPAWADPESRTRRTRDAQDAAVDAIVTSPPHSDTPISSQGADGDKQEWNRAYKEYRETGDPTAFAKQMNHQRKSAGYDAVVTSPPYAEANRGGGIAKEGYRNPATGEQDKNDAELPGSSDRPLSDDAGNISNAEYGDIDATIGNKYGNVVRATYLGDMARVYRESFMVLKSGGVIIVVVKNFVRSSKPVRLDVDTCKLLRAAGFEEVDHLYRRLRTMSFWIRNGIKQFRRKQASGKIPKDWPLPYTKFEDCLIWKKPAP